MGLQTENGVLYKVQYSCDFVLWAYYLRSTLNVFQVSLKHTLLAHLMSTHSHALVEKSLTFGREKYPVILSKVHISTCLCFGRKSYALFVCLFVLRFYGPVNPMGSLFGGLNKNK